MSFEVFLLSIHNICFLRTLTITENITGVYVQLPLMHAFVQFPVHGTTFNLKKAFQAIKANFDCYKIRYK